MTFSLKSKQRDLWRNTVSPLTASTRVLAMITFAPLLLLFDTANASASPSGIDDAIPSEHVRLDDLDLRTPHGWRKAKSRVLGAAARVCARQPTFVAVSRCRQESVARAKQELVRYTGDSQA